MPRPESPQTPNLTPAMRRVETDMGRPIREALIYLHYGQQMTYAEMATVLRIPRATVGKWMVRLGLDRKSMSARALEAALAQESMA